MKIKKIKNKNTNGKTGRKKTQKRWWYGKEKKMKRKGKEKNKKVKKITKNQGRKTKKIHKKTQRRKVCSSISCLTVYTLILYLIFDFISVKYGTPYRNFQTMSEQ